MISRWRQYMTRSTSYFSTPSDMVPKGTNETREFQAPSIAGEKSLLEQKNGSLQEVVDELHGSNGVSHEVISQIKDEMDQSLNGAYNDLVSDQGTTFIKTFDNVGRYSANICRETDPLKAQIPPCDIFSKAEMSRFFRTKRISPPTYSNYQFIKSNKLPFSREKRVRMVQTSEIVNTDDVSGLEKTKGSNGSVSIENLSSKLESSSVETQRRLKSGSLASIESDLYAFGEEKIYSVPETNVNATWKGSLNKHDSKYVEEVHTKNGVKSVFGVDFHISICC